MYTRSGSLEGTRRLDDAHAAPHLAAAGYDTVVDPGWLAKAFHGDDVIDVIHNAGNGLCPVDDTRFAHARPATILGLHVKLVPPEETIWTKMYVQEGGRFDGADVVHVIHQQGHALNWRRLLARMERHWEVLLAHLLTFRFVYPAERAIVPAWLMRDLLGRAIRQLDTPTAKARICRGPLLSRQQYAIDIAEWGYDVAPYPEGDS
jgi:hypothetical protein